MFSNVWKKEGEEEMGPKKPNIQGIQTGSSSPVLRGGEGKNKEV